LGGMDRPLKKRRGEKVYKRRGGGTKTSFKKRRPAPKKRGQPTRWPPGGDSVKNQRKKTKWKGGRPVPAGAPGSRVKG